MATKSVRKAIKRDVEHALGGIVRARRARTTERIADILRDENVIMYLGEASVAAAQFETEENFDALSWISGALVNVAEVFALADDREPEELWSNLDRAKRQLRNIK